MAVMADNMASTSATGPITSTLGRTVYSRTSLASEEPCDAGAHARDAATTEKPASSIATRSDERCWSRMFPLRKANQEQREEARSLTCLHPRRGNILATILHHRLSIRYSPQTLPHVYTEPARRS